MHNTIRSSSSLSRGIRPRRHNRGKNWKKRGREEDGGGAEGAEDPAEGGGAAAAEAEDALIQNILW